MRWIAHPETIDSDSLKLLTLYAFGLIPSLGNDWDRFYVAKGALFNTDQPRFCVSAFDLGNLWLTYQLNTEYKRQISALKPPFKRPAKPTAEIIDFAREALNNSSFPRTRESMLLIFRDTRVRGYDIFRVIQSFPSYLRAFQDFGKDLA